VFAGAKALAVTTLMGGIGPYGVRNWFAKIKRARQAPRTAGAGPSGFATAPPSRAENYNVKNWRWKIKKVGRRAQLVDNSRIKPNESGRWIIAEVMLIPP